MGNNFEEANGLNNTQLKYDSVEKITAELKAAAADAQEIKIQLLKHYLLNFILYINHSENSEEDVSPIEEELLRVSILLEKLNNMEKKIMTADTKRLATEEMVRNKGKSGKKSITPRKRFKKNFEKQEKVLNKGEFKKKANKFS